jgi:hypothetical protein
MTNIDISPLLVVSQIERTPPSALVAKIMTATGVEAIGKAAVRIKDAGEAEAAMLDIDRLISDVVKDVTAKEDIATTPDK